MDAPRTRHLPGFLQDMISDLPLDQFRTSWIVPVCLLCTSLISFINNDDLVRRYSTVVPITEKQNHGWFEVVSITESFVCLEGEGWVDEMEQRCHLTTHYSRYNTPICFFKNLLNKLGPNIGASPGSTEA
ncbi:hypothetical protein BLNAU_10204 [Blattamonas nauphoetae]|uniref:Uncharacterized protein n=1 Tax=Blattamonas nauphoetae TaxID=2049346 RepID=A0ABQ9XTS5_9EUKA|nr:hypothetical protein BLNAU_10204 [Blattamonas nauphoetae]